MEESSNLLSSIKAVKNSPLTSPFSNSKSLPLMFPTIIRSSETYTNNKKQNLKLAKMAIVNYFYDYEEIKIQGTSAIFAMSNCSSRITKFYTKNNLILIM